MPFLATATSASGDVETLVRLTAAALEGLPAGHGVLRLSGADGPAVARGLARALPKASFLGATCAGDGEARLEGVWFNEGMRGAVAEGEVTRALAEAALKGAGLEPFEARAAVLWAKAGRDAAASLFEVLPARTAFLGADVDGVWTQRGEADAALFVCDWPLKRVAAFGDLDDGLRRAGMVKSNLVATLSLEASAVKALYGAPGRTPDGPARAALFLSRIEDRTES